MMDGQSRSYFQRRAHQERVAAQQAASETAAQRHREMADEYRRLARSGLSPAARCAAPAENGILAADFRLIP
jgi:hypothetical protein